MKKIISVIVVLAISFFSYSYFSQPTTGDDEGGINIILIDESGDIVSEENYEFVEEKSLYELMDENYELTCASNTYKPDETCSFVALNNHILLGIDEVQTDWYGSYIQIIVNDVPSVVGVDSIMLEDETTYTFKYVDLDGDN